MHCLPWEEAHVDRATGILLYKGAMSAEQPSTDIRPSDPALDEQMLAATELFYYSSRFRDQLFAIILNSAESIPPILADLKVLQSSHIRPLVVCRAAPALRAKVGHWRALGYAFQYFSADIDSLQTLAREPELKRTLQEDRVPIIGVTDPKPTAFPPSTYDTAALALAAALDARKAFFVGPHRGVEVQGTLLSHPSSAEIRKVLQGNAPINISREALHFLHEEQQRHGFDLVVLPAESGMLYREIFTHRGVGTLLANDHRNVFRQAHPADVSDILMLMTPSVRTGQILPLSEEEVLKEIEHFYVYTVNGQIIATTKLTDYGEAAEIGKICTLPRYQGKGRARAAVERVIQRATELGKEYVFALTTQPRMFEFFTELGFTEVPRETLPKSWREHYDMARPSKAFRRGGIVK